MLNIHQLIIILNLLLPPKQLILTCLQAPVAPLSNHLLPPPLPPNPRIESASRQLHQHRSMLGSCKRVRLSVISTAITSSTASTAPIAPPPLPLFTITLRPSTILIIKRES